MAGFKQGFLKIKQTLRKINLINRKYSSELQNVNFVGRDIINPEYITKSELQTLLWTTKEMKATGNNYNIFRSHYASLLFSHPDFRQQICLERASMDLGMGASLIMENNWHSESHVCDLGRCVSKLSDVIVTHGFKLSEVEQLADGSNVPVINASCDHFSLLPALTYLYTLLEIMGPIRRRCLAWIGPTDALCNTFLFLGPKLGLDIKIFCPEDLKKNRSLKTERAFGLCLGQSGLHECTSLEEAVYRADVVVANNHNNPLYSITTKVLEEAALDWYLLHTLPRSKIEVTDDVFNHKNNLTWKSIENSRYVAMALLLRIFQNNVFSTTQPDFDGEY